MALVGNNGSAIKSSFVSGENSEGVVFKGTLLRVNRLSAVFELHNPSAVLRFSEALGDFIITLNDRLIYKGKAVVRNLMNTGPAVVVCEANLSESAWRCFDDSISNASAERWQAEYMDFLGEWQKLYRIRPEYKLVLADMQSYFADLRLWLDQAELSMKTLHVEDRRRQEQEAIEKLAVAALPTISSLFDQLEEVIKLLDYDATPAHQAFLRRQLHPLLLCSPFAWRTFQKPLGYAGDYEMVSMILRNMPEGGSLFAKLIHTWFVRQAPAEAHRNRLAYLIKKISEEIGRLSAQGRPAKIFNVACGPAIELQQFLADSPLRNHAELGLLDFNEETLDYVRAVLEGISQKHGYRRPVQFVKKSVHHLLKESAKPTLTTMRRSYDLVYCAGLFDYLSNNVCQKILDVMYDWVAPGGLLIATNVDSSNPRRYGMEHLLDWHLIYRTGPEMRRLKPALASPEEVNVFSDTTGVNVFLEVRRPTHA